MTALSSSALVGALRLAPSRAVHPRWTDLPPTTPSQVIGEQRPQGIVRLFHARSVRADSDLQPRDLGPLADSAPAHDVVAFGCTRGQAGRSSRAAVVPRACHPLLDCSIARSCTSLPGFHSFALTGLPRRLHLDRKYCSRGIPRQTPRPTRITRSERHPKNWAAESGRLHGSLRFKVPLSRILGAQVPIWNGLSPGHPLHRHERGISVPMTHA